MAKNRFVQKALAFIKGDKDEALVLHNATKAEAAIEVQLGNLKGEIADRQQNVVDAEEALERAKYPSDTKITDRTAYIKSIAAAQERLDKANEALYQANESNDYYTALLAEITAKVDA